MLGEVPLPKEARIQRSVIFNVRLEVENEQYVKTYINNVLVDEREGSFPYGRFGFRQAHDDTYGSEETARFDDVKVTVNGVKVFEDDFSGDGCYNTWTETYEVYECIKCGKKKYKLLKIH